MYGTVWFHFYSILEMTVIEMEDRIVVSKGKGEVWVEGKKV